MLHKKSYYSVTPTGVIYLVDFYGNGDKIVTCGFPKLGFAPPAYAELRPYALTELRTWHDEGEPCFGGFSTEWAVSRIIRNTEKG